MRTIALIFAAVSLIGSSALAGGHYNNSNRHSSTGATFAAPRGASSFATMTASTYQGVKCTTVLASHHPRSPSFDWCLGKLLASGFPAAVRHPGKKETCHSVLVNRRETTNAAQVCLFRLIVRPAKVTAANFRIWMNRPVLADYRLNYDSYVNSGWTNTVPGMTPSWQEAMIQDRINNRGGGGGGAGGPGGGGNGGGGGQGGDNSNNGGDNGGGGLTHDGGLPGAGGSLHDGFGPGTGFGED